jgi:mannose-6-phosphate isomerase
VVPGGRALTEVVAAAPAETLGEEVAARFGARLPYLMKLLAAGAPLSLQAHPDAAQAAAGYAAEEAAGVPRDARHRRYADPYHKPELLVAVSEFRALCGFRDPAASAELLAGLGVAALRPVVAALAGGDLAAAVRWLLELPGVAGAAQAAGAEAKALVAEVVAAAAGAGSPYGDAGEPYRDHYRLVGELAATYPGDVGVVVALLLNQVSLAPGEAIFMPAGNLHAYLHGTGVEIMAASDNVLRGGLTPKHVDVPELLRVLRFEALPDPVLAPVPVAPGVCTWPVPVPEFALHRVRLAAPRSRVALAVPGPRALLCLAGEVEVDDGVSPVTLGPGRVAFGAGSVAGPLVFAGTGEAYVASVGNMRASVTGSN